MIKYAIRLIITGLVIYLIPNYTHLVEVDSIQTAILVAFVMSLLNTFIKPIFEFLSFPITVLTLGLFYFVINFAIVYICDYLIDGFAVQGIWMPIVLSFIISMVNNGAAYLLDKKKK